MIVLLIYGAALAGLGLVALLFYVLSVQSRKRYHCPNCGERYESEHLEAAHCNSCGAPLNPADH